jgi:hypothetical protein
MTLFTNDSVLVLNQTGPSAKAFFDLKVMKVEEEESK